MKGSTHKLGTFNRFKKLRHGWYEAAEYATDNCNAYRVATQKINGKKRLVLLSNFSISKPKYYKGGGMGYSTYKQYRKLYFTVNKSFTFKTKHLYTDNLDNYAKPW